MKKELKEFIKKNKLSDDDILKLISKTQETQEAEETDVMNEEDEDNESENQPDSNSKEVDEKAEKKPASKKKEVSDDKPLTKDDISKLVAEQLEKVLKEKKSLPRANQVDKNWKANEWGLRTS